MSEMIVHPRDQQHDMRRAGWVYEHENPTEEYKHRVRCMQPWRLGDAHDWLCLHGKQKHGYHFKNKRSYGTDNRMYRLERDLLAFKRVFVRVLLDEGQRGTWGSGWREQSCIANLVIPSGALVLVSDHGVYKCRADKAYVHSIHRLDTGAAVATAYAWYNRKFNYYNGMMVHPTVGFAETLDACASGIHFYLEPMSLLR